MVSRVVVRAGDWLDAVVAWFNHEYVWDIGAGGFIPTCWPLHPHLVHEIAVLADQRRRAGIDTTSASLEEWHRYSVPAFIERLRARTKTLCDEDHKPWPARSRCTRFAGASAASMRAKAYEADTGSLYSSPRREQPKFGLSLVTFDGQNVVDPRTGEVLPE